MEVKGSGSQGGEKLGIWEILSTMDSEKNLKEKYHSWLEKYIQSEGYPTKPGYNSLSEGLRVDTTKRKRENNVTNSRGMHWERKTNIKETSKGRKLSTI